MLHKNAGIIIMIRIGMRDRNSAFHDLTDDHIL